MRVLLIDALNPAEYIQTIFPGLGSAYLASYLRRRFHDLDIRIVRRDVAQALAVFRPQLVGISSVTQNFGLAQKYAQMAKQARAAVVVGGLQISVLPNQLSSQMDVGVIGEGEATFEELLRSFDPDGRIFHGLDGIDGLVFRRSDGELAITKPRQAIRPLDSLPLPARDLLDLPERGVIHLFSSRGCPYRCRFCASSRFWKTARYFSPDYVINELREVVKRYDPSAIFFFDDLFVLPKKRFRQIAERIVAEGYHRKIDFNVNCRANLVDDETARLLRSMNVVTVNFGFESASERTLRYLKGPSVSVRQNSEAVRVMRKQGINVSGTFIIGSPQETRQEILDTFRFISKSEISFVEVYILTPLPGTPIWDYALSRGLVCEPMDWHLLDQQTDRQSQERIILSEVLSREEIYQLLKQAEHLKTRKRLLSWLRTAFTEPSRIPRYLLKHGSMAWHRRKNRAKSGITRI